MKNIEIELRYKVLDVDMLSLFIEALSKTDQQHIIDTYLDTESRDLIKKGIYLRVRNNKQVDIKFNREYLTNPNDALQTHCEDYTFMLPLAEQDLHLLNSVMKMVGLKPPVRPNFVHFKEINKLVPFVTVDKKRTSYTKDGFTILIDEFSSLGTFLEIELMAQNSDQLEEVTAQMKQLLLPLTSKKIIVEENQYLRKTLLEKNT